MKQSKLILDEHGYKFGGDADESPSARGKGSSPTRLQRSKGEGTRVLSDRAQRRLETLSEISLRGEKARDLFRLMGDPSMWMLAYSNIYPNKGAVTKGVDNNTLDGFSEDRALNLIECLKEGIYSHKPVRRTYIPKSNGKLRPLGIPTGDDKLVQEVARIILEHIYEPIFIDQSHGFRPRMSCHTALHSIQKNWYGVKWVVNVDIKGYFDNIDHEIMIKLLEKRIDDKRFIELIKLMLKAGYMENWTFHNTHSGTPQGGIISPLLSNIYLHEMDCLAQGLKSSFDKGKKRKNNPEYRKLERLMSNKWKQIKELKDVDGYSPKIEVLLRDIKDIRSRKFQLPSRLPMDEGYRRLHYCRYADDFIFGIIGSKAEAQEIFDKVKIFLSESLNLEISTEKSGVLHFTKGVKYLGYIVSSNIADKVMKVRAGSGIVAPKRTIRGVVTLQVPSETGMKFALNHGYFSIHKGKRIHRSALLHRSDEEIILTYNAEFRGLVLYYALAKDVKRKLSWLEYIKTSSMLATLANKHKSSITKMHSMLSMNGELVYKTLIKGKEKRIVVYKLKHLKVPNRHEYKDVNFNTSILTHGRSEIIQRLNAGKCEYCGRTDGYFEVHHKNKIKTAPPGLKRAFAQMRRKTIVLCVPCHDLLHAGKLPDMRFLVR